MMSTRRSFLQSAVFLPSLLSAHAFAQDTQNNKAVPFADFEDGWGDWTTEGLAFGTRPATSALFPGKISGFGGRGFVCTLHPRKGNAATGKAVSREFTIEHPFITFKIGGGNFPGQACLNLVVDNKIERTATGDGSASLSEKSWDVSALVGKKARLEIVDDTVSDQRGYVLVDDIAFVTKIPAVYNRDGFMPPITASQQRILSFAIQHAVDNRVRSDNYEGYGVPNDAIIEATNKISWRIIQPDFDHVQGQSVQELARRIKTATAEVITKLDFKPNEILTQRLTAQALSDWLRTHFIYDDEWAKFNGTPAYWNLPYKERERHFGAVGILNMDTPKCVCAGFANTTVEMGKLLGLKCYKATGYQRWGMSFKNGWPEKATHSWAIFEWSDGLMVPADNSISSLPLTTARSIQGHLRHSVSLPLQAEEWGVFLSFQYSHDDLTPNLQQGKQDIYSLNTAKFPEWQNWNLAELASYKRALPVSGFGGFRPV